MDREYTRVDTVRRYVDGMLNDLTDPDKRRTGRRGARENIDQHR